MADGYISQIKTPDNKTYLLRDSEKTDEKVKQTSNAENKEFPIILKNTNNTTDETAGVKYAGGVTVNPSDKTVTATEFIGNIKANRVKPTIIKEWNDTSFYGANISGQDVHDLSTFWMLSVKPDSWYEPWVVRFKITTTCPAAANYYSVTYCMYSGRADGTVVFNWNERYDHAHYYTNIRTLKKAGFDAGLGHAIGINLYASNNYTNANYYRSFKLEYYDCDNCTVTILDNPIKWANWPDGTTTNYNGNNNANAVDRGLQESGDANSYDLLQMSNNYVINGSFRFPGISLFGYDREGHAQPFSLYQSGYTSYTASISNKATRLYNTNGIDWTRGIHYNSSGGSWAENTNMNISTRLAQSAIDLRYTDNCVSTANTTLSITSRKAVYIRGTLDDDGLFHVAPLDVAYNGATYCRAWTQDIPIEADNYVYWFVGYPYYTSAYQVNLYIENPLYWYHNGRFEEYRPASTVSWTDITNKPSTATSWPNWNQIQQSGANSIAEGSDNVTANTEILTSYASNNGFADTNGLGKVYRRDASKVVNATLVKAALGTNATHNNTFLRKDGTWATALVAHQTYTAFTGNPADNQTPGFGSTFTIQQISQSTTGQVSGTDRTVTIPSTAASTTTAGLVNTDAQTFAGVKTFDNGIHIYGTISTQGTGSTAGTMYPGGAYHSGHNSIVLHGDTSGVSGIGFTSEKATKSGTTTNINSSSDRAFIQYHAYGVTPAAEGTAPTLATSGEAGVLVLGVGNDATDTIRLQAPGTAGILHQIGATAYPIPHTTNTNGSVGGTTTPVYVDAGVIKAGTALGGAAYKAENYYALSSHNHDSTYSYTHLSDYDFTDTQPLSKYVTFDKSKPTGAPKEEWYNGFISSHSNYHASYIINGHTNQSEWYVGHGIWREANTPHATAPTWYLLAHSGNVGTGDNNGQVKIAGQNVSVKGLKALAYKDSLSTSDIPDLSWNKITSDKPTTISGYGITDAKIASGTITLGNNTISPVTAINWDSTNKKLTRTINGAAADVVTAATLRTDLGLSNALHFIGVTSTTLADGSTTSTLTAKSTGSLTKTTDFVDGDVVMDGDQLREYVWSGSAWRLLGITTSTAYTQPTSTATNTWIAQVSQGTDGKITATTGSLNTSGTWSGNATTATTATYIKCTDTRNTALNPTDLTAAQGIRFDFKAKGTINLTATDTYAGVMSFRPYASNTDWSGGNAHQLAFNSEGLHWRNGGASWGDWYQILDSSNTTTGTNNNATLTWNTTYTIAKINGTDIKFTTMTKPTYTASDVGLGNVENTKLSTWTGSTNITTLGTITTGTWNGTAIANNKLANSSLTVGNKSISLGASGTIDEIITYSTTIGQNTSWDITNSGAYPAYYSGGFSGDQNPSTNQNAPYSYGTLYVMRANTAGAAQFYISHHASSSKNAANGIRYRSGWDVANTEKTVAQRWEAWATILDDKNYNLYSPKLDGTGATGSWGISITGNAANVTGTVAIDHGGTGATSAADARTNLGLGTIATKADTAYVKYAGNITGIGSGSPASGAQTWWKNTTNVPKLSVVAAYNNSGSEKTFIFSKGNADATYGSILMWGYGDRYLRILRKNNSNADTWVTTDWEKIDAGYADSAGTATSAGKWTTACNISISDSDGTNTGTAVSVDGSAAVTLKLPATIKATVIGDGSQLTSLKTQNLVRPAGLNGVNDVTYQALINDVRANRLAFLPADQIIIEKTTDGGITWEDAGISDGTKTALFSETRPGVSIPKINNEINTSCGLRITITAMKYDVPAGTPETQKYNYWNSSYVKSTERYNQIKLMYFWVSTATNALKVTVQKATGANPNSWINVFSNNNYGMTGWSGNDIITFGQGVFGGGTTQTGNTWNWRITLMTCGPNGSDTLTQSNLTSTMMVSEIRGYGDTYWTAGNKYAASDHLYSWDYNKNATFPSNITASKFIGALQGNADTATKFNSTRKIELTGAVTGSATTDGSSGWTISTTVNHNHDNRYSIASGVITLGSNTITPVTSVNGHSGSSVSVTASDLGLASALKYVGTKSSLPTATDSTTYSTYNNGDVITVSAKEYAYVKGSNAAGSSWVELGDEGSYKLKQTAFTNSTGTADGTNTSTAFIYSFSQDENGAISNIKTRQLPTLTNVSYTAATDNNEYPILLKNSTGSDTTAAGVKFANTTNKMTTINPSTGMITAPSLTLASNAATAHLAFARAGWNYVTMPNNDSSVISIGYGTQADNTTQRLVIYKTGTVRPGANGSQNLGDDTHKWNKVYGVNFYGTFNGTATSAQQLAAREIDNSDLNQFSSGGALKYAWVSGGNNILSKPTDVNAFGVIAMKTAASWTGQLLMSTDSEPGLYWRTNLTTETPTYGSWTPLASGNGGVYYGTCETAADVVEKVVVCKHYHTLKAGDIIVVTFTNSNTQAQPKLNVNNTGAVGVKMAYSGGIVDLGSTTQLSYTCTFIYNGANWLIINQQNTIQLATASNQTNWRSILLSNSNSGDENFTPSANTLGRTYAAHNVKYQPSTGTLRAPIMKTPKVQIEFNHVNKAHIEWNDTDSSIDFIFD